MKREHYAFIDALNVAASLGVVLLHFNYVVWQGLAGPAWRSALAIETLCFWLVPVFFTISSATLIDYRECMDTKAFFRRRIERTALPWLFWSLMGLAFHIAASVWWGWEIPRLGLRPVFNGIVGSEYVDFYWFFPVLLAMYLSIPILSNLRDRDRSFEYLVALSLLFNALFPLIHDLTGLNDLQPFAPPAALGWTVFVLIGYRLMHWEPTSHRRWGFYFAGLVGGLVEFVGTAAFSNATEGVSMVFLGSHGPCVVSQSVAVFVFFKSRDFERAEMVIPGLRKCLASFSSLTFGIYLIHWFVLKTVQTVIGFNSHTLSFRIGGR